MHRLALLVVALGMMLPTRTIAQAPSDEEQAPPDEEQATPDEEQAPTDEEAAPQWWFRISAEGGVGGRVFDLPMDGVVYRTDPGLFPVAGLGVELEHAASKRIHVSALGRYQSSIDLEIVELHTDGSAHPIDVRAHRLEAGLSLALRFDDTGRWALALGASYGVLGFRPLLHQFTPAFTLSGPLLRAQLQAPIVPGVLRLRVGPEGQWIVQVGRDLTERGMASSGVSLGGEAALELLLGHSIMIHAAYREAWSLIDSSQAQSFKDIARFVTAGVTGTL
jgi:hypothetical protein